MGGQGVVVVGHDAGWRTEFAQLGQALRSELGETARRIDHIGSTAVSGLAAKPILDIQISVASLEPMTPYLEALQSLGFLWRSGNPDLTKRYFREAPGDRRTHIHVRRAGSWNEQFALLFRDFLRHSEAARTLYQSAKQDLARRHRTDRQQYTEAKTPVIWQIMQKANRWAQQTGWQPGPSDA